MLHRSDSVLPPTFYAHSFRKKLIVNAHFFSWTQPHYFLKTWSANLSSGRLKLRQKPKKKCNGMASIWGICWHAITCHYRQEIVEHIQTSHRNKTRLPKEMEEDKFTFLSNKSSDTHLHCFYRWTMAERRASELRWCFTKTDFPIECFKAHYQQTRTAQQVTFLKSKHN